MLLARPVAVGPGTRLAAAGTAGAARTGPRRQRSRPPTRHPWQARDLGGQQGQADPAHDAVDGGNHAGPGEQHPRWPGPQPHRGHRGAEPLSLRSWAEELLGLGHQAAVVAADPLHLPQQHQVLQGVAQQGGEGELAQEEHARQHRSHERVEVGDDLGQEPKGDQRAGHRPHIDGGAPGHLADVGAAGGLEDELLGGQGADERLLACLLLHADAPMTWRDPLANSEPRPRRRASIPD
jgi:hypothetical protein